MGTEATGTDNFDMEAAGEELSVGLFGEEAAAVANAAETGEDDLNLEVDPVDEGAKPEDDPAAAAKPAEGETEGEAKPDESKAPSLEAPPKTWRAEAAAKWKDIPAEVQKEILKREEDIFKGIETYKEAATFGVQVDKVISPYKQFLQEAGYDPVTQIDGLMQAHYVLAKGSPEQQKAVLDHLVKSYNINYNSPASEDDDFIDPAVKALQAEVNSLKSTLTARTTQEVAATKASLQNEINTFAADPNNPYFDEVASDIAALLRGGAAKNLKEAYDKAVWANPVTRQKEQARLAKSSEDAAKAAQKKKAEEVRRSTGANVKSRSRPVSATAPLGSIDDTLEATLAEIQARSK